MAEYLRKSFSGNGEDIFMGKARVGILFKVFELSASGSNEMEMFESTGFFFAEELVVHECSGQVAYYLSLG